VEEIAKVSSKEVSCKIFQPWFRPLAAKNIALDKVIAGTSLTIATIRNAKERISWGDVCTIHSNLRPYFTDQELVEFGHSFFRSRALRYVFLIARLLLSPMGFFRWTTTPGRGGGAQVFACITPRFQQLSPDQCEIELTLPQGYEVSWEFFLITRGSFEEAPRLLGYGAARVELERMPNGGRFRITIPTRTPLLTRLRRAIMWPFTIRAVAGELKEAHEDLAERYAQLEQTRNELEIYKTNLEKLVDERTAELRQARDELSATVEQLKEAERARERFFGNISHEIRTPLSLILLAAADTHRRLAPSLDERSARNLGAVSDAAHKLVRLVDELLVLAAGRAEKLRLHPEPTDLALLIENGIVAWRLAAEHAGLTLEQRGPDAMLAAIDPVAMERVISNLVSNAVKYTPKGGAVDVELAFAPEGVRLSVLDTGPGIDHELAGRLFGRFERASGGARRSVGTGIGLALVKELVEAHGGTISAVARDAGGTEMRVMLPASVLLRDAANQPVLRRRELAPAVVTAISSGDCFVPPGLSEGTIVLAEDDAALAESIAKLLADHYKVIVATDGKDAVELIRKHRPHLLVTDVDMPGLNGIELSRRFRELTGDALAPIIILSAVLDLGTRIAGLEAGAVDYVAKPFDPLELVARVRSQFRMRDMAMRLHRAEHLSALGILTAGLAHELRNPANGIVNAVPPLRRLLASELTNEPVGKLVDVMSTCATQIAALSQQLLSVRNDGADLELRPAEMPDLVERAVVLAHRALEGVEVRRQLAITAPVSCAAPLLVQVLANLIENAAHAAGRGGWVEIRGTAASGRITVEVADSGPGVPLALRERIFEPFFTTKAPGSGTGLGLPVARAIVLRHGGVLEVRDRGPHHAFVIELPDNSIGVARNAV
jgi:signal transduction histidine kinase